MKALKELFGFLKMVDENISYGAFEYENGIPTMWEPTVVRHSPPVARFLATCDAIRWLVAMARCHFGDHQYEDNSSAGPESGNMDMFCSRCGYCFNHTLY